MARIAEQEVERLKQEVSVQRLAEARRVKLKQHGKDLIGLCPFHDDREPSLVLNHPRLKSGGSRAARRLKPPGRCPRCRRLQAAVIHVLMRRRRFRTEATAFKRWSRRFAPPKGFV